MKSPLFTRAHVSPLFMTACFIGMVCTSCIEPESPKDDESNSTPYESVVVMSADIVMGNEYNQGPNRVHLGPDNTADHSMVTEIRWTEGDEVACWNAEEGRWAAYMLTSGANTTSARFQGKAVHKEDDVQGQAALNISHAIFPLSAAVYDGTNMISPGHFVHSVYFTMPGTQVYQAPMDGNPTFGTQYNVMTGTRSPADFNHVRFRSVGGVLLLRIKGAASLNSLYGLKLTSRASETLWGTFTAAIGDGGAATVEVAADINGKSLAEAGCPVGDNSLVLDCRTAFGGAGKLPTDQFTNFYFVVPYGVFSTGFTVAMDTDGDGDFDDGTITTSKNNTIVQSDIKVMPALELTSNVTMTWDLDDLYNQGTVNEF